MLTTQSTISRVDSVNGVPSCANSEFLTGLLRERWGFDGLVVSDCQAIENELPTGHNFTGNISSAVALSIRAGTDTDCENSPRVHSSDSITHTLRIDLLSAGCS